MDDFEDLTIGWGDQPSTTKKPTDIIDLSMDSDFDIAPRQTQSTTKSIEDVKLKEEALSSRTTTTTSTSNTSAIINGDQNITQIDNYIHEDTALIHSLEEPQLRKQLVQLQKLRSELDSFLDFYGRKDKIIYGLKPPKRKNKQKKISAQNKVEASNGKSHHDEMTISSDEVAKKNLKKRRKKDEITPSQVLPSSELHPDFHVESTDMASAGRDEDEMGTQEFISTPSVPIATSTTTSARKKSSSLENASEIVASSLLRNPTCKDNLKMSWNKEQSIKRITLLNYVTAELKLATRVPSAKSDIATLTKNALTIQYNRLLELLASDENFKKEFQVYADSKILGNIEDDQSKFMRNFTDVNNVIMKPFLSDEAIHKILSFHDPNSTKDRSVPPPALHLMDGDVIHVPFSVEEDAITREIFAGQGGDMETSLNILISLLPGRSRQDCKRYLEGVVLGPIPGRSYSEKETIVYKRPAALQQKLKHKDSFHLVQDRQFDFSINRNFNKFSHSIQNSLFKKFHTISSSTLPGGAVVDGNFHPTRHQLAVSCTGAVNNALIYSLETGRARVLTGHTDTVSKINFSRDGEFAITTGYDKCVKIWSSTSGKLIRNFEPASATNPNGHNDSIWLLALHSTENSCIATSAQDRSIFLWNIEQGTCLSSLKTDMTQGFNHDLTFCNGRWKNRLLGGFEVKEKESGKIILWNVDTGTIENSVINNRGHVSSVSPSAFSDIFLSGDSSGVVEAFDMRTMKSVNTFITKQPEINVVSLSPCERFLQSSGEDNKTFIFDQRFSKYPLYILEHKATTFKGSQGVTCAEWTKQSDLITGGEDNIVRIWNLSQNNCEVKCIGGHAGAINFISIFCDEGLIASGADEKKVQLYSYTEGHSISEGRIVDTTENT